MMGAANSKGTIVSPLELRYTRLEGNSLSTSSFGFLGLIATTPTRVPTTDEIDCVIVEVVTSGVLKATSNWESGETQERPSKCYSYMYKLRGPL